MSDDRYNDLQVHVRFDDVQLSIIHEGKAGDLALQQAILLQLPQSWAELLESVYGGPASKAAP